MANVPYPLVGETQDEIKRQVWELIRELYEDRIAGLSIGDVFRDMGDVLDLRLSSVPGLEKYGSPAGLQVYVKSDGGLSIASTGVYVKCKPSGHLDTDSEGLFTTMSITKGGRSGLNLTIKDASNLYCSGGSIEINGSVYDVEEQLTLNLSGTIADTTYYIYVQAPTEGSTLTSSQFLADKDNVPTWVDAKGAYYHPNSANYRYVGACKTDNTPVIESVWFPREIYIKVTSTGEPADGSIIYYDADNDCWTSSTLSESFVTKGMFDANTIIKADSDNNPEALEVGEGRLIGRLSGGQIAALTAAQTRKFLSESDYLGWLHGTGTFNGTTGVVIDFSSHLLQEGGDELLCEDGTYLLVDRETTYSDYMVLINPQTASGNIGDIAITNKTDDETFTVTISGNDTTTVFNWSLLNFN